MIHRLLSGWEVNSPSASHLQSTSNLLENGVNDVTRVVLIETHGARNDKVEWCANNSVHDANTRPRSLADALTAAVIDGELKYVTPFQ